MAAVDTRGFQPRTLDKVERLLDLVDEMQRHPDLKGKLAMHGGTAINLFMLDSPCFLQEIFFGIHGVFLSGSTA